MKKVYIIKKIIEADSMRMALQKEKDTPVEECYLADKSYEATIANIISDGQFEKEIKGENDEE